MESVLLTVFLVLAAVLIWIVVTVTWWYGYVALHNAGCWLRDVRTRARLFAFAGFRDSAAEKRRADFRGWFNARFTADGIGSSLDDNVLQAKQEAPLLGKIVQEELPKTIRRCVAIHRLSALAAGAEYVYQIALEPECFGLRERTLYLTETAMDLLSRYPLLLDDPTLMHNLVVLRTRILPICRNCPYLDHRVSDAPLLCPSAEVAGISDEREEHHEAA